jgi:hypothetical protein
VYSSIPAGWAETVRSNSYGALTLCGFSRLLSRRLGTVGAALILGHSRNATTPKGLV